MHRVSKARRSEESPASLALEVVMRQDLSSFSRTHGYPLGTYSYSRLIFFRFLILFRHFKSLHLGSRVLVGGGRDLHLNPIYTHREQQFLMSSFRAN